MLANLFRSLRQSPAPPRDERFAAALAACMAQRVAAVVHDNVDADRWTGGAAEVAVHEARLCRSAMSDLLSDADAYARTYALLEDEVSRDLFVQLIAYRLLGHAHVRLPTNSPAHWAARDRARALPTSSTNFTGPFGPLRGFEVDFEGERIRLESWWLNVAYTFIFKQYFFERDGVTIAPKRGDRLIDAGACFADTALAFAAVVGPSGRIVSFEIDPMNAVVARRNLEMNAELGRRIDLREAALAKDRTPLYREGSGPGARVTVEPTGHPVAVETIDALVASGTLDRVDFIKMDVEGAERFALEGAEQTLRRNRPALAISIYHRPDDIRAIPLYLHGLGVGYRFYLDHYTIHNEETVLYSHATGASSNVGRV